MVREHTNLHFIIYFVCLCLCVFLCLCPELSRCQHFLSSLLAVFAFFLFGGVPVAFFNSFHICTVVCESFLLLYAENMWGRGFRAFLYFMGLSWCFLGIAIVSDMFMNAIEVIVANKRRIKTPDGHVEVLIWNPTVGNMMFVVWIYP